MNISKMTLDDLENIKFNLVSDFDDFWSYEVLKDELSSSSSLYFALKNKDELIGFCGIKIITDFAEIMNIVIKKNYRGKHYSDELFKYILDYCTTTLNLKSINLEVNAENTTAINLYKKYNFVQVGCRKKYYNNNDAILMTLKF